MSILQRAKAYLRSKNIRIRTKMEEESLSSTVFYNRGWITRESDGENYFSWDVWFRPEVQFSAVLKRHSLHFALAGFHVAGSIGDYEDCFEREWSVKFHSGTLYWCLGFSEASWSRSEGWRHSWWNVVDTLLGAHQHSAKVLKKETVRIALPGEPKECNCGLENCSVKTNVPIELYVGEATLELATWKRPRWFKKEVLRIQLNFPNGVPSGHKGPTYRSCAPARSIEEGVGEFVGHILKQRKCG